MKITMGLFALLACFQSMVQAEEVNVKKQAISTENVAEKANPESNASKTMDNKTKLKNSRTRVHSTMLGMSVTGNSESPRMLTIVPWRSAEKQSQSANISPVWQPHLGLLDPDSYGREVRQFLDNKNNLHEKNAN